MTQRVCEIIAILAPVSGFPPKASGKMTVLSPSAGAVAKKVRKSTSLPILRSNTAFASILSPRVKDTIIAGSKVSRRAVAM